MRYYAIAAILAALLAGCGDATGPDLAAASGADTSSSGVVKPNMDPARLSDGR
jgi:hypothetical protein